MNPEQENKALSHLRSNWTVNSDNKLERTKTKNAVSILKFVCPEDTDVIISAMKDEYIKNEVYYNQETVLINDDHTWGIQDYDSYTNSWNGAKSGVFKYSSYMVAVIVHSGLEQLKREFSELCKVLHPHISQSSRNSENVAKYDANTPKTAAVFRDNVRPWMQAVRTSINVLDLIIRHRQAMIYKVRSETQSVSTRLGRSSAGCQLEISPGRQADLPQGLQV